MKVYKGTRKDGSTYRWARPIIDGTKEYVQADTIQAVEREVAALKEKARRRRLGLPVEEEPRADISYGALCDLLLDGYTHSEQSKRQLGYNLRYSRDRFESVLVRNIRFEEARSWFARLDSLAPTTRRNALIGARQAMNFAVETRYAESNPFRKIDKPQARESKHPFESWDEVYRVAAALERSVEKALVIFVCATGLRPQEWRALQWRDIAPAARVLRINRTVQNGRVAEAGKTDEALRAVELIDRALDALDLLPRQLRREQLVFPSRAGGMIDTHSWSRQGKRPGAWTRALVAAGVEYREPRQMRHSFATLALVEGATIEWIAKQMGHKEITTTLRHYHRWLPSDRRNLDTLNRAYAQTVGQNPDIRAGDASE